MPRRHAATVTSSIALARVTRSRGRLEGAMLAWPALMIVLCWWTLLAILWVMLREIRLGPGD